MHGGPAVKASRREATAISAGRISARVEALGRELTREYTGRRVDVVVTLDRGFVFAADLLRELHTAVVCHFVREDVRDVEDGSGHERREVFFGTRPELQGRDVLLLDAVLESGVTQEFLLRRLGESRPRSLRLVVLLDKPMRRRVGLEPDYFGFRTASNQVWVGYGLAAANGTGRNLRALSAKRGHGKRRRSDKR